MRKNYASEFETHIRDDGNLAGQACLRIRAFFMCALQGLFDVKKRVGRYILIFNIMQKDDAAR